ncbi:Ccdc65 [Symbiodinium natans]|uniref:Ccdc65 protein n=1 Tax=Symbiodinium natans TaxID=878477 RepID=A0A812TQR0_9DINO|nr:Ccdc65 [Symbiodinium natans]
MSLVTEVFSEAELQALCSSHKGLTTLLLWAPWHAPSVHLIKVLEAIAGEQKNACFAKVDIVDLPIKLTEELLVTAAIIIALVFLWTYRANLMLALTGDSKLHGSFLDCVWCCCFQCCGLCTGEWTGCFTMMPCCPPRWRRQNLVRMVGKQLGLSNYTVELRNLVVGDLPFDGRADIFLSVECSSNPAMKTSVAEDRQAKVIHYPEVLTVRLRHCFLEENVRISVFRLNVVGSEELCTITVGAMNIIDWARNPSERMKRFQLKSVDHGNLDRETPAWLLVEFGEPIEVRDLDNVRSVDTIRTTTSDMTRFTQRSVAEYKHTYYLLDSAGHAIDEPFEEDLAEVRRMRTNVKYLFHVWNVLTLLFLLCYAAFRSYVWSCYRRFEWLTMAVLNNATIPTHFPLSFHAMESIGADCQAEVSGTGLQGVPCRPSIGQVNMLCQGSQYLDSLHQPWPVAYSGYEWEEHLFGSSHVGLRCMEGICSVRQWVVEREYLLLGIILGAIIFNCLLRWTCEHRIQTLKARKLRERQQESIEFRRGKRPQNQNFYANWF